MVRATSVRIAAGLAGVAREKVIPNWQTALENLASIKEAANFTRPDWTGYRRFGKI